MTVVRWTAAVLLAAMPASLAGQGLAEVARKEEERRKGIGQPARVYTNDQLRDSPAPAAPAVSAPQTMSPPPAGSAAAPAAGASASGSGAAAGTAAAPKPPDDPKKSEAQWRQRVQQARDAIQRAEIVAAALQSRINALSADFVNRDDPAQRALIETDRQQAVDELARVKKEIAQLTKAAADLQDEGRRAGVPAGWLR